MLPIQYYTVNTNEVQELNDEKMQDKSQMESIIKAAQQEEGIDLKEDIHFRLFIKEEHYVGTLCLKYDKNQIPLLITVGTRTNQIQVWDEIVRIKEMLFPVDDVLKMPPAPYVVNMAAPSLYNKLEVFHWTDDFTRRIGLILLSLS